MKPYASLPEGVPTLITDPQDPNAIPDPLRSAATDPEIDVAAVSDAVRRYAPPDVVLVEHVGGREHVLPR